MLQVGSPCGLCNRLDVIITGYVLARARGEEEIEVLWPVNNQMPASFHDLFTALPSGRVVECNLSPRGWRDYPLAGLPFTDCIASPELPRFGVLHRNAGARGGECRP